MKQPSPAFKVSICAVLAALSVAVLAVGSLIDVLDLSLALAAGLFVIAADIEFSEGYAVCVFVVTATVSLFLPVKSAGVAYALFFGWYPLFRKRLDPWKPPLRWLVKYLVFNAVMAAYLALSLFVLGAGSDPAWLLIVTAVLANLLFVLYDLALDRMILLYHLRLRGRFRFRK